MQLTFRAQLPKIQTFSQHTKGPLRKHGKRWERLIISGGYSAFQHRFDLSGSCRYEAENKYVYPAALLAGGSTRVAEYLYEPWLRVYLHPVSTDKYRRGTSSHLRG